MKKTINGAEVIVVHGLWMPGLAMSLLAGWLARYGFTPRVFEYQGRRPIEANIERLARFSRSTLAGRAGGFLGHSLGGLLVLEMLNRHAEVGTFAAVLLAAPVRGCLAGRRLALSAIGRWMLGESAPLWAEARAATWRRAAPLGVIAGTRALGLARALGRLPGPNDGVVRVEETAVEGMRERVLLPVGHSTLIASARAARLAARFLRTGTFAEVGA
jgi:pimeloyl-ACP methyl ester carboxylesterase